MTHEQKAQDCAAEYLGPARHTDILKHTILKHFPEPQEKVCRWEQDVNVFIYKVGCLKNEYETLDKMFEFCPYCGGKIV